MVVVGSALRTTVYATTIATYMTDVVAASPLSTTVSTTTSAFTIVVSDIY